MTPRSPLHLKVLSDDAVSTEGPVQTFEEVYRVYYSHVARVCLRILGRRDEVEDAVQDTFLQAHRELTKLRHPDALRAWLTTCAVRIARKKCMARRVKQFLRLDDAEGYEDIAGPSASPHDRLMLQRVYGALDTLPSDERIAWALRHIEGEPLESVALLCGCSLATTKRRIQAAQRRVEERCGDV